MAVLAALYEIRNFSQLRAIARSVQSSERNFLANMVMYDFMINDACCISSRVISVIS